MRKGILFSVIVILIAVACTKKVAPTTSNTETSPAKSSGSDMKSDPAKPIEIAEPIMTKDPTPTAPEKPSEEETGGKVYNAKCGKCHALKNVGSYSFNQWEGILKKMVPNAKLSADEESQVVAYIKANSK